MRTVDVPVSVVSWPFRLGVLVRDSTLQIDLAAWTIDDLAHLDTVDAVRLLDIVNPGLPYRIRRDAVLAFLEHNPDMLDTLREAYYDADEDDTPDEIAINLVADDRVDALVRSYALTCDIPVGLLALPRLGELLEHLDTRPLADHALMLRTYRTLIERRPLPDDAMGEGMRLFGGDEDAWRDAYDTPLAAFDLNTALRAHWGWRTEFSDLDRPDFRAVRDTATRLAPLLAGRDRP